MRIIAMKALSCTVLAVSMLIPAVAEVTVGPSSIERTIYGQNVKVEFFTDIDLVTDADGVKVKVRLRGDLSDLQRKFNAIVQTIKLPNNNCPGYGTHVLPTIEDSSLEAAGTAAIIKVRANAVVWQCIRNPVPESVCENVLRCYPLGFARPCLHVPECHFREGSPIKTILVREGFWGELPISITTQDHTSLSVVPGRPNIQPRGDLGKYINNLAGIFNVDLSTLADKELDKLVDANSLKAALPGDLQKYDLAIESASFTANNGKLGVSALMTGRVSPDQLTGFLQKVLASQPKGM